MSENFLIHLTFLEPYRLAEWCDAGERKRNKKYLRGQSFARWHKNGNNGAGKPYIPGTLLRSAVIRAAEELLSLNDWQWNGSDCCNGDFLTPPENKDQPTFRRKRPTWQNFALDNKKCQSKETACPFCILLGRFDNAQKNHKANNYQSSDYAVHFCNLDLQNENSSFTLKDIALERILNRVDYTTGKAHDYFRIWEIDNDEGLNIYSGTITLQEDGSKAKELLCASLGFVDKLCGAICRIKILKAEAR